jgi:hypothetical protein
MCEFSAKLIAWMDRELPQEEAVGVECHVLNCVVCRQQLDQFVRISNELGAFCQAVTAPRKRGLSRRRIAVSTAAAATIVAAVFLTFPRWRSEETAFHPQVSVPSLPITTAENALQAKPLQTNSHSARRPRTRTTPAGAESVFSMVDSKPRGDAAPIIVEPSVEIAIPADAVLPPGAAPEGIIFVGAFTIGPDGSAQQLRIEPQLIGFERGLQ